MPGGNRRSAPYGKLLALAAVATVLVVVVARQPAVASRILAAVMGFTAVVFIHECGHFLVAKAVGIKVQVFSIFLPPVLVGVRRTESGYRIRFLPEVFPSAGDPDGGLLSITIGRPGRPGDTEYRIGLIPIAGYVKMLGQDDLGPDKQTDDPRSFGNKSVGARMAVIAAGVICNVLAAVVLSTVIYLIGIEFPPPVVGSVIPGSPAQKAGLIPGDRIIEIAGRSEQLQPDDIIAAAVLSDPGEPVPVTVARRDGTTAHLRLVSEHRGQSPVRLFGIELEQPRILVVAKVDRPQALYEATGLREADQVVAVDGIPVQEHWQLQQYIAKAFKPNVVLTVVRATQQGHQQVDLQFDTSLGPIADGQESESDLRHVYGLVPRLEVVGVQDQDNGIREGDIIVGVAGIENPTYLELRNQVLAHKDKDLSLRLLRTDPNGGHTLVDTIVRPKRSRAFGHVVIGVFLSLDADHPVVAKAIPADGLPPLPIPRGSTITHVAGLAVKDFYAIGRILMANAGKEVSIRWRTPEGSEGSHMFAVDDPDRRITARCELVAAIPFKPITQLYKADGIAQALRMGAVRSVRFVVQTYVTVKQLLSGAVKVQALSGPVGIATIAYQAVGRSATFFLYMLAFISANLAVVNFLPLPVVDGGLFVMLIVEKIRGAPLSPRVQEIITYLGLVLIGSLFLYLTYNDLLRLISG